jgi:hypothetical protein
VNVQDVSAAYFKGEEILEACVRKECDWTTLFHHIEEHPILGEFSNSKDMSPDKGTLLTRAVAHGAPLAMVETLGVKDLDVGPALIMTHEGTITAQDSFHQWNEGSGWVQLLLERLCTYDEETKRWTCVGPEHEDYRASVDLLKYFFLSFAGTKPTLKTEFNLRRAVTKKNQYRTGLCMLQRVHCDNLRRWCKDLSHVLLQAGSPLIWKDMQGYAMKALKEQQEEGDVVHWDLLQWAIDEHLGQTPAKLGETRSIMRYLFQRWVNVPRCDARRNKEFEEAADRLLGMGFTMPVMAWVRQEYNDRCLSVYDYADRSPAIQLWLMRLIYRTWSLEPDLEWSSVCCKLTHHRLAGRPPADIKAFKSMCLYGKILEWAVNGKEHLALFRKLGGLILPSYATWPAFLWYRVTRFVDPDAYMELLVEQYKPQAPDAPTPFLERDDNRMLEAVLPKELDADCIIDLMERVPPMRSILSVMPRTRWLVLGYDAAGGDIGRDEASTE